MTNLRAELDQKGKELMESAPRQEVIEARLEVSKAALAMEELK